MVGLGFVLGVLLASRRAARRGIDPDSLMGLFGVLLAGGVAGGRILYVLTNAWYYSGFLSIFNVRDGGLSIHGVLAGGLISAAVYARSKHISLPALLDLLAPSVILGQAVGRIGCLLAGCCYGIKTSGSWGVPTRFAPGLRHPYPLYESLADFALFFILISIEDKVEFKGGLFARYLMGYSGIRFVLEFFRDNDSYFAGLSYGQWVSLALVIVSAVFYSVVGSKTTANRKSQDEDAQPQDTQNEDDQHRDTKHVSPPEG